MVLPSCLHTCTQYTYYTTHDPNLSSKSQRADMVCVGLRRVTTVCGVVRMLWALVPTFGVVCWASKGAWATTAWGVGRSWVRHSPRPPMGFTLSLALLTIFAAPPPPHPLASLPACPWLGGGRGSWRHHPRRAVVPGRGGGSVQGQGAVHPGMGSAVHVCVVQPPLHCPVRVGDGGQVSARLLHLAAAR